MGAVQNIVQILDVQVDLETRLVVAGDHHGSLCVHDGGACQTALDGLKDQLRVHTSLLCQRQRLGQSLDVAGHDDLVGQLGSVAGTHLTAADRRSTHGIQHRLIGIKDLLLAAYHKAQGAVNGLGFTAGDGSIQHLHALLLQLGVDLLGGHRVDGRAVNEHCTGLHVGNYAVFAQHHLFDLRRVGQHSDDNVALLTDLLLGGPLCTGSFQFLHGSLAAVIHQQIRIACLQQVLCHRFAHDAQTDKSNFHNTFSFI